MIGKGVKARLLVLVVLAVMSIVPVVNAEVVSARVEFSRVVDLDVGVDGTVAGIAVGEGEAVVPETLLLYIDDQPYQAALKSANASFELAKEELAEAIRSHDRNQVLYDDGSLSTVELDQSRIDLLKRKAVAASAAHDLADAESRLRMSRIVASKPGVVVEVNTIVGAHLNQRPDRRPAIRFGLYPLVLKAAVNREQMADQFSVGSSFETNLNNSSVLLKVRSISESNQNNQSVIVFEGDITGVVGNSVQINIP